jgi:hypothetical protein
MTLVIMTLVIMTLVIMTLVIMTLVIMTLFIMTLGIRTFITITLVKWDKKNHFKTLVIKTFGIMAHMFC